MTFIAMYLFNLFPYYRVWKNLRIHKDHLAVRMYVISNLIFCDVSI